MKVKIFLFFVFVMQVMINSGVYAADNIGDVRDSVKRGWSDVAWGKHIKHADYAALAACMATPASAVCVSTYLNNLLRVSAATLGRDVVLKALKDRGKVFRSGRFEVQAGIATYNHWHRENPCSIAGRDCSFIVKEPNTHQPYVRWRKR